MSNGLTKGNRPPFGSPLANTLVDNPLNRNYKKFEPSDGERKPRKTKEELDEYR